MANNEPILFTRDSDYATRQLTQLHLYFDHLAEKMDSRYLRLAATVMQFMLDRKAEPIPNCECFGEAWHQTNPDAPYPLRCSDHAVEFTGVHPGRFVEVQKKCPFHNDSHYIAHSWGYGFPLAVIKQPDTYEGATKLLDQLESEEACINMSKLASSIVDEPSADDEIPSPKKEELAN